ncbi:MAG: AraC family transcriptional regulator [Draconibacterium sp.]
MKAKEMTHDKFGTSPEMGKEDRFFGDRSVVLSKNQLEYVKRNTRLGQLYFSDIGFYPNAKNHFRQRKNGIGEHILIYCVDGFGTIDVDNQAFSITPNSFFVIPAELPHSYWSFAQAPWSIYWVHFGGKRSSAFEDYFGKINALPHSSDSRTDDRIRLFNEILTVMESGFINENMEYSNLCLNGLLASFFYVNTYRAAKGVQSSDPVDRAIFFMADKLEETLTIHEIARHVNLSESHLSKLFRNKTGASPLDYFIKLKMQEAIRLLTNQSLNVKEVAFLLGYKDPFYFSRLFTQHIGENPRSFLKTTRK